MVGQRKRSSEAGKPAHRKRQGRDFGNLIRWWLVDVGMPWPITVNRSELNTDNMSRNFQARRGRTDPLAIQSAERSLRRSASIWKPTAKETSWSKRGRCSSARDAKTRSPPMGCLSSWRPNAGKFAILGDEGINKVVPENFWQGKNATSCRNTFAGSICREASAMRRQVGEKL